MGEIHGSLIVIGHRNPLPALPPFMSPDGIGFIIDRDHRGRPVDAADAPAP